MTTHEIKSKNIEDVETPNVNNDTETVNADNYTERVTVNNNTETIIGNSDSETITLNKITIWKTISVVLGFLLVISIFTEGFNLKMYSAGPSIKVQPAKEAQAANQPTNKPTTNPSPNLPPSKPSIDMAVLIDDDALKGDKDASVTIVEWSDYECPFCERFYSQTLGSIEKDYIKTGKVKFVYRDFPLGFHQNAQKAAEAAECAGEENKYWEMHNLLFEKGVAGGVSSFKQYAVDIGLDANKFNECLDSGKMASETAKDLQDGQDVGISGTPGFIINGQLISGAQPFSVFKQVIDAELVK